MIPKIICGGKHSDTRGKLMYNNDFDMTSIKRMYIIENQSTKIIRAWQGHQIEQRWFLALKGAFKIELIAIDNWSKPSKDLQRLSFTLSDNTLHILHIPSGYVSSIQSLEEGSQLQVMADYWLNELQDDFRFDVNYFD
jgi:dTDP-4-dehydrorhamnose 3,5-epimerase-like enzyme